MKRRFRVSLATKFAASFAALIMVIMLLVTIAVHQVLITQFSSQYQQDVRASLQSIQTELSSRRAAIAGQLRRLAVKLEQDSQFRLFAVLPHEYHQDYIKDYAQDSMPAMGLESLAITNRNGLVLSCGHDRNASGHREGALLRGLQALGPQPALAWFQSADSAFLCLTTVDSVYLDETKLYLLGGNEVNAPFLRQLHRDTTEILVLHLPPERLSDSTQRERQINTGRRLATAQAPDSWPGSDEQYFSRSFKLPLVTGSSIHEAAIYLWHPKTELTRLLHGINERVFAIMGIGIIIAVAVSVWRARAIAKPLRRLAAAAGTLSLDNLEVELDVRSHDETGILSEAMRDMIQRLRKNHVELTKAEQKAALAEIAREVNHDIKNGLIPLRNVMQHWMEVAELEPERLIEVFNERKTTVLESVNYLENLARGSSQLAQPALAAVNVNQIIRDLLKNYQDLPHRRIRFSTRLDPDANCVPGDPVQLRRAFENILQNALEAVDDDGKISVTTESRGGRVFITWKDNGAGMPDHIRDQIFHAQVTSKPGGTGLGLVNVKRIVENSNGTVAIESRVAWGTVVRLALPQM